MSDELEVPTEEKVEADWYPDPDDPTGKWLRFWDGEDWSDIPARLASATEREELVWPEAPGTQTLEESADVKLDDVLLLGGHGFPLFRIAVTN